jgi:hypothetical protein
MFQYGKRRLGPISRWWRRRDLGSRSTWPTEELYGDAKATFTTVEEAELAQTHAAQRTIERRYNGRLRTDLRKLARRAPRLERRVVRRLHQAHLAGRATGRLLRAEAANPTMRDGDRHMNRWIRLALVLALALIDVVAYRAAVEVAFDVSDADWMGRAESFVLGLLSVGMVIAAMGAAEKLKALHDAIDGGMSPAEQRARRRWRQVGVPALLASLALLVAGAMLRVNALIDVQTWFWVAVPLFSAAAMVGAFVVEYKWASEALDEHHQLERREHAMQRRLHRADRRLDVTEGRYRNRQTAIETLWSSYHPEWLVQMEMAANRIAVARAAQGTLFHPRSESVTDSVHAVAARMSTRLDAAQELRRMELTAQQVIAKGHVVHVNRLRPAPSVAPIAVAHLNGDGDAAATDLTLTGTFEAPR